MKGHTLLILIIICGIFAYIGLKPQETQRGSSAIDNTKPFDELAFNSITKVELKKGGQTVTFAKQGEKWRTTTSTNLDFPLNFKKFHELLISLKEIKLETRVTRSDSHDAKFGLDDASKPTQVTLMAGDKSLATLSLGKNKQGQAQAPNPQMPFNMGAPDVGQYFHMNEDKAVYLTPKPIRATLGASYWIVEELATASKADMSSIEFDYPHKSFKLDKSVSTIAQSTDGSKPPKEVTSWKASGDLPTTELDSSKVADLLDDLDEIKVSEPVKSDIAKSFDKNTYRLKVMKGEEALYEVKVNKVKNDWYIHDTSIPNEIYKISSFRFKDVFAKNNELFNLKKMTVADNISEITIKDVDRSYTFNQKEGAWSLSGKAPLPKAIQSKFGDLITSLKGFDAKDYLHKNIPSRTGKELIAVSGKTTTSIHDLGDFPIDDAKLLKISDQKLAYSVSAADHEKFFPKLSDLVEFKAPSNSSDDLKSIKYSDFELKRADNTWQFANGDGVNDTAISSLWTSYESIFDSAYLVNGALETVKVSFKVTHSDDSVETINIGEAKKGYVIIKSSRFGGTFRVNLDVARSLLNGRMSFVKAVDKTDSQSN